MEIKDFTSKLIAAFDKQITDQVFLFIESERELMSNYLNTVANNELNVVNSSIAKAIKKHYELQNLDSKNESPKSKLIESYEEFKK